MIIVSEHLRLPPQQLIKSFHLITPFLQNMQGKLTGLMTLYVTGYFRSLFLDNNRPEEGTLALQLEAGSLDILCICTTALLTLVMCLCHLADPTPFYHASMFHPQDLSRHV